MSESLLGKGTHPSRPDKKTLYDHTRDVVQAGQALFGTATRLTRLGEAWLRFFGLQPADGPRFADTLLAAMWFHDLGKANEHMQRRLDPCRGSPEGMLDLRHEHLSVLLLAFDWSGRWRKTPRPVEWPVVLAAVGSHHLKFGPDEFAAPLPCGRAVKVHTGHDEFRAILAEAGAALDLPAPPALPAAVFWGHQCGPHAFDPLPLRDELKRGVLGDGYKGDAARLLRAVRAALIAADAAGSGLPRQKQPIADWIGRQFPEEPGCDGPFVRNIVQKRVDDLAARGKWTGDTGWDSSTWNTLQKQSDHLGERALVLAPCGYGKTLAAWRWIAARTAERPVQRVIFLYPTRATATEGFKDYVSWAPEADAGLLHGTAGFDLDGMFPAGDDRHGRRYAADDPRLFALQHWGKRVFSATVDQFLAFLSYGYGPVCLLPLLADSVLVVDEVHSFDPKMFSALLRFLGEFRVPVLCMTATLPKGRIAQLQATGMAVCDPPDVKSSEEATAERYEVRTVAADTVLKTVVEAVRDKKRVLWVVNQVSRAQAAVDQLRAAGLNPLCYHSRFNLNDRRDRHRAVVEALRPPHHGVVAVTTQVCEMSLDIDADVLVTERCPITSLVQRMGRCRRTRGQLTAHGVGTVRVYEPAGKELVYDADDLTGLDTFLASVTDKPAVSQTQLEEGLTKHGPQGREGVRLVRFLNDRAWAVGDEFRDTDDRSQQAVLSDRVDEYKRAADADKPGFVLSVPRRFCLEETPAGLPRWLGVAPAEHYDPLVGFRDPPKKGDS